MKSLKLSTKSACRIAGIDRDKFNDHVTQGRYPCAPATTQGRGRYFDPDDMIALRLFVELTNENHDPREAARMACAVAACARSHPDARQISLVYDYFEPPSFMALPSEKVPDDWDNVLLGSTDIRREEKFRIGKLREIIARKTEEELTYVGEPD